MPGVETFDKKIYIPTANVINKELKLGEEIDFFPRKNRANMQPKENSVWFAKMKNSPKHIFVDSKSTEVIRRMIFSTGFLGLQCSEISFGYLSSLISDPSFEKIKDSFASGATQEAINNSDLNNMNILIPDNKILKEFSKIVNKMYYKINKISSENRKLTKIKNFLSPLLMNNQIKIED